MTLENNAVKINVSEPDHFRLLIVDDDVSFIKLFKQLVALKSPGRKIQVLTASSGEEALDLIGKTAPDVVISDVQMPGLDGIMLTGKLADRYPGLPVILLTAYGSIDKAVEAVKKGAYHFFQKPLDDMELFWKTVSEAASRKQAADELETIRQDIRRAGSSLEIIGNSPAWMDVYRKIEKIAPHPTTVLITGETGTGKEVVARTIHRLSPRANRPFVAISCVEFAGSLLEAELFGHERGAFTGAVSRKRGIFERAHGGTLFLDEISETSPELQAKLLRVIEGHFFHRVGGQEPIESDFRLIAATNRDMEKYVAAGSFRSDLYYRLNVYPVHLPPLRERKEDILPLALHFVEKTARKLGRPAKTLSGEALLLLAQNKWRGNVRELENLIERGFITAAEDEIMPGDLFPGVDELYTIDKGLSLEDMERLTIHLALTRSEYNKSQAADLLGISRKTLADKMNKYNIQDSGKM